MNTQAIASLTHLLEQLGERIRDSIRAINHLDIGELSRVERLSEADTIYGIDKISEATILDWLQANWPSTEPLELVMEGLDGEAFTFPVGHPVQETRYKLIIDPIDGTRNIMYDKRSAWALIALAEQHGPASTTQHIVSAVMTELPPSKQSQSDQISAIRGCGKEGLRAQRYDFATRCATPIALRPSAATDLKHGFASNAKYFPSAKAELAQFEEELMEALLGKGSVHDSLVFDDQYISTGGQLYELMVGHDRLIMDLRPLAYAKLGLDSALTCHPYDICCELIAREAGVIVEDPFGQPIQAPLDTTSSVAWIGYANETLANTIRPILNNLVEKRFKR